MGNNPIKKENQNNYSSISMKKPDSRNENKILMDKIIGKFFI